MSRGGGCVVLLFRAHRSGSKTKNKQELIENAVEGASLRPCYHSLGKEMCSTAVGLKRKTVGRCCGSRTLHSARLSSLYVGSCHGQYRV